jgi:hypothetical protein
MICLVIRFIVLPFVAIDESIIAGRADISQAENKNKFKNKKPPAGTEGTG